MRGPTHHDLTRLAQLERRLGRGPHAVLQVPRQASIGEICEAFAGWVHGLSPERFAADASAALRARRALRQLHLAFRAAIGRELEPPPRARAPRPRLVT